MPRELHALRSRLVSEIRESDDIGRPGRRDTLSVQGRGRPVAAKAGARDPVRANGARTRPGYEEVPGSHTSCTPLLPLASPNWESVAVYAALGRGIVSEQPPSWDPYQDPRQYQGQQYQAQQQPYGYQQPYGQQPRQPSFSPDPQYGTPPGQPPYQHQAQYPGTSRGQAYTQWQPEQYDPEPHRQRLRDEFTRKQADPGAWQQADPGAWQQPHRRNWSRGLVYAGIAALIVIAGGGAGYAFVGHEIGSAGAAKPLTCKQQYDAWKTGPARAPGKQFEADLSKVSGAGSADDIMALTSALKTAGADATALEQYPMPACADPGGYWAQMLARIKAAGDNAGSASGLGGILLADAPLKQVPGLQQKLSAELKRAAITGKS
jgi:hypothetical protein